MKTLFLIILFSYVCLNLMLQLFNISCYHCTEVIVHAYRFLDVIEPFDNCTAVIVLNVRFLVVLEPLMMALVLLCIMWDSRIL